MSSAAYFESEDVRRALAAKSEPIHARGLLAELAVGGTYVLATVALALQGTGGQHTSVLVAALYVAALAAAARVRFDFGEGFTVPTQVVFVPMLFALPVTLVPVLVPLAFALAMVPGVATRKVPASRLLTAPSNSWYAWGPAAVLWLARDHDPNGMWGVLVLALIAQLACDFLADLVRERLRGGVSTFALLSEFRPIFRIDLALSPVGLLTALAVGRQPWALLMVAPLFAVMHWFSRERRARLEQLIELNDAYRGTALVLGDVIEADDSYTGQHCKSVVQLAVAMARELELSPSAIRKVEFAALLHDVGKIAVPKAIINKPGELDEAEWAVIKTHTLEGQRMLERVGGFMREVGKIVRSSHERWDGKGYPDGLAGAQIAIEARIVSCCDAYNAMTTTRSYRKAMPADRALAELQANSGTQFDPEVVEALARLVADEAGAPAQVSAGQHVPQGIVPVPAQ